MGEIKEINLDIATNKIFYNETKCSIYWLLSSNNELAKKHLNEFVNELVSKFECEIEKRNTSSAYLKSNNDKFIYIVSKNSNQNIKEFLGVSIDGAFIYENVKESHIRETVVRSLAKGFNVHYMK